MKLILSYVIVVIATTFLCGNFAGFLLVIMGDPSFILTPVKLWVRGSEFAQYSIYFVGVAILTYGLIAHIILRVRGKLNYHLVALAGAFGGVLVSIIISIPHTSFFVVCYSTLMGVITALTFQFIFAIIAKDS